MNSTIFAYLYPKYTINKPIRLIELFAGIGSQAKALQRIGANFEHYKVVEFDKYAIASYNAIHNTNFPTLDITKIKAEDLEIVDVDKYEYIMTYSFPCFTGDSLVLTNKGFKKIIDVKVNDYVLTHDNTYKKVVNCFDNGIKEIYSLKGQCIDEIKTTFNHKFYVRNMYHEWNNEERKSLRKFKNPEWKELNQLTKNDYLGIAINQNSIIPNWNGIDFEWKDGRKTRHKNQLSQFMNNKDFWYIIGRYMGDGWQRTQGGIIICCAKNEINDITEKLMFNYSVVEEKSIYKIHIPLKELGLFVDQFGKGAKNKRLTNTILDLPIDLLKHFIKGYEDSDGCVIDNIHKFTSVSKELIYGIAQCVAKVYKTPYRIYKSIREKHHTIENRIVNQNDTYQLYFKIEKKKQDKAFYENGYIWFPIKKIEKLNMEKVYDIEVEDNHSFTVQNVIVHNCQDLSLAGVGKGMTKGTSTRSGLLWEVERILDECLELNGNLPQCLLMENVPMIHSEKHVKDFKLWVQKLENLGYKNYIHDLNSKHYGIPQNRDRCFMVSVLGDYSYEFPTPFKITKCVGDLLENEVEEKYFISDKMIEKILATEATSQLVLVKEATKKGYAIAQEGDGIYINRPHQKRGVVQKGMCQTIKTQCDDIGVVVKEKINVVGNYSPSGHEASRIIDPNGITPTIKENHGTINAIIDEKLRIRKYTPKEVFRLMGFDDEDFEKASKVNSNAQLYKQAGNSIVVNVLEAIFKEMMEEKDDINK